MKQLSKIVWSEGMYLAPHHFQAQNQYFEDSVQFAVTSLWRDAYGLVSCEFDGEAIRNGTVALVHAVGVFPDGLPFDMPECDALPPARNISELFSPVAESLTVSLAIPRRVPGGPNCSIAANGRTSSTRYVGSPSTLADENSGQDEKAVTLGRKNITLVLDTESQDQVLTLPVARVLRDGAGHFVYDPHFIPACLKLSASDALVGLTQRLVEILEDKSASVSRVQPHNRGLQVGISAGQVAQFWFLHALNSHLAPLRHLLLTKHAHPEELFRELLRLGGALCAFGLDSHPRTLPVYDHLQAEACFTALDDHIRRHLEIVLPSKAISIPLTSVERYFYEGQVKDQRCLGRSRWILGVQAKMGEGDLIAKVPHLVKMCSSKFVPELVKRAVPGLSLTHIPVPPASIVARVESQYFTVSRSGPCWEHIVQTKRVGVYVPGEFLRAELELAVILED